MACEFCALSTVRDGELIAQHHRLDDNRSDRIVRLGGVAGDLFFGRTAMGVPAGNSAARALRQGKSERQDTS